MKHLCLILIFGSISALEEALPACYGGYCELKVDEYKGHDLPVATKPLEHVKIIANQLNFTAPVVYAAYVKPGKTSTGMMVGFTSDAGEYCVAAYDLVCFDKKNDFCEPVVMKKPICLKQKDCLEHLFNKWSKHVPL